VGGPAEAAEPDDALCRVSDALDESAENMTGWDTVEPVVNPLLDVLVEAGYLEAWGHSDSGCIWAITYEGHERLRALGRQDA
jgi:hypothetical protein